MLLTKLRRLKGRGTGLLVAVALVLPPPPPPDPGRDPARLNTSMSRMLRSGDDVAVGLTDLLPVDAEAEGLGVPEGVDPRDSVLLAEGVRAGVPPAEALAPALVVPV